MGATMTSESRPSRAQPRACTAREVTARWPIGGARRSAAMPTHILREEVRSGTHPKPHKFRESVTREGGNNARFRVVLNAFFCMEPKGKRRFRMGSREHHCRREARGEHTPAWAQCGRCARERTHCRRPWPCADTKASIVSTGILGRRTAPIAPFLIPHPRPTWFCG